MVSTRRKIMSEQDRFGGYSSQPSARISIEEDAKDEYTTETNTSNFMQEPTTRLDNSAQLESNDRIYTSVRRVPVIKRREQNIVEYSNRLAYPATDEYASVVVAQHKQPAPRRREREDLMPSIKTRAYGQQETEQVIQEKQKTGVKLSSKNKAMLAVYMFIVVVLAALVIATGIAVSSINNDVSSLENEILARNQQIVMQNSTIDKITDKNYIAGVAMGNDMIKVDNVVSVDELPITETIKYESRSNWFDKISDWLSKIIGG